MRTGLVGSEMCIRDRPPDCSYLSHYFHPMGRVLGIPVGVAWIA
jgi:hypothetical protein